MELRSKRIDATELRGIVRIASDATYAGNVIANAEDVRTLKDGTHVVRFSLRVRSSREKGAHKSPRGRRTVSACWHAHRDIMREIFRHDPDAFVGSMMARYEGELSFLARFPATYYRNAGSMARPIHYGALCECGTYGPRHPERSTDVEPNDLPQRSEFGACR